MTKCPVCQKQKSEYEMRPLFNVEELKVGEEISGEKNEREIAGAKVSVVCRSCWAALLENRSKEEIIEMLETVCGLLFESDKAQRSPDQSNIEKALAGMQVGGPQQPWGGGGRTTAPMIPGPAYPSIWPPNHLAPAWPQTVPCVGTGTPMWTVGVSAYPVDLENLRVKLSSSFFSLGAAGGGSGGAGGGYESGHGGQQDDEGMGAVLKS